MGLFTVNPETVAMGAVALRVISLGFVVSAVSVTLSGALEGLGKEAPSLAISPVPLPGGHPASGLGALPNHRAHRGVARLLDHRGGGRCGGLGSIPPGPPRPSPAEGNPRLSPAGTVTPPFSASVHAKEEKLFPFSLLQCFLRCGIL